jgi:hypothetical protein
MARIPKPRIPKGSEGPYGLVALIVVCALAIAVVAVAIM